MMDQFESTKVWNYELNKEVPAIIERRFQDGRLFAWIHFI